MSNLPGNPYAELAEADIEYPGAWNELEAVTALLQTSARATLALAYEQRTANLLKVLELQGRMHDAQQAFNLSAFDVAERLGLGDTK